MKSKLKHVNNFIQGKGQVSYLKYIKFKCNQVCMDLIRRNSSNGNCFTIKMTGFEPNQYTSTEMSSNQ